MKFRKSRIYKLREGALVTIRGTGSLGGDMFRTTSEKYVMCTSCGRFGHAESAAWYLEGYFVEPSIFGCLKNEDAEIVFSDSDVTDGPFTEDDMTVNPMLCVYGPMTKDNRQKHLSFNKEWLERQGIHLSEPFIEKADVSGFMEMHKAAVGGIVHEEEKKNHARCGDSPVSAVADSKQQKNTIIMIEISMPIFIAYGMLVAIVSSAVTALADNLGGKSSKNDRKGEEPQASQECRLNRGQIYGLPERNHDPNNPFFFGKYYTSYMAIVDVKPSLDGKGMPYFQYIWLNDNMDPEPKYEPGQVFAMRYNKDLMSRFEFIGIMDMDSVNIEQG